MTATVLIIWAIVVTLVAVKCRRGLTVYIASSALAVIPIAVSQREYGFLPMAGALHALTSGLYPLVLFALLRIYRKKGN